MRQGVAGKKLRPGETDELAKEDVEAVSAKAAHTDANGLGEASMVGEMPERVVGGVALDAALKGPGRRDPKGGEFLDKEGLEGWRDAEEELEGGVAQKRRVHCMPAPSKVA